MYNVSHLECTTNYYPVSVIYYVCGMSYMIYVYIHFLGVVVNITYVYILICTFPVQTRGETYPTT